MSRRICFIIPYLADGGAERVVSVLASQLAEDGEDVVVLLHHRMPNEYIVSPKVAIKSLVAGMRDRYTSLSMHQKLSLLRRRLIEIAPDYVVPFLPHVAVQVALAGVGLRYEVVQTLRIAPQVYPNSKIQRVIRDRLVGASYATFVQNERQRDYFPSKTREKIVVLPNPVSPDTFAASIDYGAVRRFVSVGRLSEQKNFSLAIDAMALARSEGCDVELDIFGEGELRDTLQRHIDEIGAAQFCRLRGRSNRIVEEYAGSDAFLLTSDYEGMPNALLEAMAVGLPCIATDCPTGPRELIGEDRGRLAPVGDREKLAEEIGTFVRAPEAAAEMGKRAKQYVAAHYSAEVIARRFMDEVIGH